MHVNIRKTNESKARWRKLRGVKKKILDKEAVEEPFL